MGQLCCLRQSWGTVLLQSSTSRKPLCLGHRSYVSYSPLPLQLFPRVRSLGYFLLPRDVRVCVCPRRFGARRDRVAAGPRPMIRTLWRGAGRFVTTYLYITVTFFTRERESGDQVPPGWLVALKPSVNPQRTQKTERRRISGHRGAL